VVGGPPSLFFVSLLSWLQWTGYKAVRAGRFALATNQDNYERRGESRPAIRTGESNPSPCFLFVALLPELRDGAGSAQTNSQGLWIGVPRCGETPGWGPWSVKDGVIYAHAPATALAQVLALRVHLDDSIADNGPLRVLPGTHKMGVLSDDAIHRLAEEVTSVDCLVPRGGVLAMRPLIVHASSKSRSELPRWVLHLEYVASRFIENGLELAVA